MLWERSTPNRPLPGPPYLHANVEAIWTFFVASLAEAARIHPVETIVPTTHGAAAVLVDDHGLAMPAIDYEEPRVEEIEPAYAKIRPPFRRSYSPSLAYGLNVGRQLAWQRAIDPEGFARARHLLFYPQYWAWRMTGVAATEATSIACHTDLWMPGEGRASDLVAALGLEGRVPPLLSAWAPLGPPSAEFAAAAGLGSDVRVLCGVHDSNASIIPYLAHWPAPFTVVSTGTWVILLGVGLPIDGPRPESRHARQSRHHGTADGHRAIYGRARICRDRGERSRGARARSPAGADRPANPRSAGVQPAGRPVRACARPHRRRSRAGRTRRVGDALCRADDRPHADPARRPRGRHRRRRQPGANAAFGAVLAQLRRGQNVVSTRRPIGAAYGAAMLASWPNCPPLPELLAHASWEFGSLEAYREDWLERALAGR